jgi:hypothetical protein
MTSEKWDSLLMGLRSSLADVASMVCDEGTAGAGTPHADFHPTDETGVPMTLLCLGESEMLLFYGDGRARWELDWTDESVEFIKDVARAVCTGKFEESHAPGRVYVEVFLPNGSTTQTATCDFPLGLIPLPGWKRRKKPEGRS